MRNCREWLRYVAGREWGRSRGGQVSVYPNWADLYLFSHFKSDVITKVRLNSIYISFLKKLKVPYKPSISLNPLKSERNRALLWSAISWAVYYYILRSQYWSYSKIEVRFGWILWQIPNYSSLNSNFFLKEKQELFKIFNSPREREREKEIMPAYFSY